MCHEHPSVPFYYCYKSAVIGSSRAVGHSDWPPYVLAARLDWLLRGPDFALIGRSYDSQSPAKSRTEGRKEEEVLFAK